MSNNAYERDGNISPGLQDVNERDGAISPGLQDVDVSEDELGEYIFSNHLRQMFGTTDTKVLVKKLIRATKKDHSPELQFIMGDDYAEFVNLSRKEKVERLGDKINMFCRYERTAIKRMADRLEGRKMQRREIEDILEDELDEQILSTLKNVSFGNSSSEKDRNSSALKLRRPSPEWNFKTTLSFWKDVESSNLKDQIIEAMQKHGNEGSVINGCENLTAIVPYVGESPKDTVQYHGETTNTKPKEFVVGRDLKKYNVHFIYPYFQIKRSKPFYKKPLFILLMFALFTIGVLVLYYYWWKTSEESKCYLCDGVGVFFYRTAMQMLMP